MTATMPLCQHRSPNDPDDTARTADHHNDHNDHNKHDDQDHRDHHETTKQPARRRPPGEQETNADSSIVTAARDLNDLQHSLLEEILFIALLQLALLSGCTLALHEN